MKSFHVTKHDPLFWQGISAHESSETTPIITDVLSKLISPSKGGNFVLSRIASGKNSTTITCDPLLTCKFIGSLYIYLTILYWIEL